MSKWEILGLCNWETIHFGDWSQAIDCAPQPQGHGSASTQDTEIQNVTYALWAQGCPCARKSSVHSWCSLQGPTDQCYCQWCSVLAKIQDTRRLCQDIPTSIRSNARLIRRHQEEDEVCRQVHQYVEEVWSEKHRMPGALQQFWSYTANLTIADDLLSFDSRILIPSDLRLELLDWIHEGHQGIQKCGARAQESIWLPGIS